MSMLLKCHSQSPSPITHQHQITERIRAIVTARYGEHGWIATLVIDCKSGNAAEASIHPKIIEIWIQVWNLIKIPTSHLLKPNIFTIPNHWTPQKLILPRILVDQ